MVAERRGAAMGTDVHLVVADADAHLLAGAWDRIADLERRWSRFLADSELAILNRNPGRPVIVSTATFEAVSIAVAGWHATDGRFDPTVHDALVAAGYDRTFAALDGVVVPAAPPLPAPTPGDISLDTEINAITVPEGVRLDLGGIGKGIAADRVSADLLDRGAAGACVAIGGDVRVRGTCPFADSWPLTLPVGEGDTLVIEIADGGACTSTTTRRRWATTTGESHHLIDPRTGRSLDTGLATATVCAADAARAEILTKSALLLGRDGAVEHLEALGLDAVLVADDGAVTVVGRPAALPA